LIDTANAHELLESVFTLAEHPARDLMEEAARKSVEHRTWDRINEELIERYRETIRAVASQKDLVA
jgi:phosphatidylinositol alpha 1,6-mannosyltransferase